MMKQVKMNLVLLLCMVMALPVYAKEKTKVIAHRGYWKTEGSAQNSLRSLELANQIKAYGSEFDVHLTADNIPVVHHDNTIQGIYIQKTNYADLKNLKLENGENMPTLEQYLTKAKKLKVKLIFELKGHATPERDREAAKIVVDMINKMKLGKRTEYISFSMPACMELIRLAPKNPVFYLSGNVEPKKLKELGFAGLDYHFNVFKKNPTWIQEAKDLGLGVNVWTVDDQAVMKDMISQKVDFITTDEPETVQGLIKSEAKK